MITKIYHRRLRFHYIRNISNHVFILLFVLFDGVIHEVLLSWANILHDNSPFVVADNLVRF